MHWCIQLHREGTLYMCSTELHSQHPLCVMLVINPMPSYVPGKGPVTGLHPQPTMRILHTIYKVLLFTQGTPWFLQREGCFCLGKLWKPFWSWSETHRIVRTSAWNRTKTVLTCSKLWKQQTQDKNHCMSRKFAVVFFSSISMKGNFF